MTSSAGINTVTYKYFDSGLRAAKKASNARLETRFILNGGDVVLESHGGQISSKYVRGLGLIYTTVSRFGYWYMFNAHGDVVQLTDFFGAVVKSYDYDAFGVERDADPNDSNPFRYCGEYFDKETGTYYLRARYYNPGSGRFVAEDPYWNAGNMIYWGGITPNRQVIMQSSNLYVYVINNPIRFSDPTGLFAWNEHDDHVFNIRREVLDAGGTFTFNRATRTILIDIYGVSVSFGSGDWYFAGSNRTSYEHQLRMTAFTFYNALVNAAGGEMVFLGGHGAFGGTFNAPHLHIAMFAASGTDGYNALIEAGSDLTRWGLRYGYISGTLGGFVRTRGQINGDDYMTRANRQFFNHLSSDVGTITALFAGFNYFETNHNNTFAYNGRWTNSTSYTIGLVNAMGLNHGLSATQVRQAWGINNAFAAQFFGR